LKKEINRETRPSFSELTALYESKNYKLAEGEEMSNNNIKAEDKRLEDNTAHSVFYKKWGPYLSKRQWGTVREDYSEDGESWDYFPHGHARSRAYRWVEDGLAGISDIYQNLFRDLACKGGYAYMGKAGSGHFVKMVHNGIEYGMMQALAEGVALMKASTFELDLTQIAKLYNHKSVVESRLVSLP
jgi:predicted DNA-binding protein (MmcQ/YjbR family)